MSEGQSPFHMSDVEVAWNGDHQEPWIDVDLHTTEWREDTDSTVYARLTLSPDEAIRFAASILTQVARLGLDPRKDES